MFFEFCQGHSGLVVGCSFGLTTLLHQGISEPEFYGDLVITGKPSCHDQFRKIIKSYKRVKRAGYRMDIMRQSACLVLKPIRTVYSYGFLFNCMAVGQTSHSMATLA